MRVRVVDYSKAIVCGSRAWGDADMVRAAILDYFDCNGAGPMFADCTIVHGACSRKVNGGEVSADMLADRVARELGMRVMPYPADWARYGNGAGPLRNARMVAEHADAAIVIALTDDTPWKAGSGTWDCVERCLARGIPLRGWSHCKE